MRDAEPGLRNRAGPRGHVPRPSWRPQTHFEARGLKLGHGVWDLLYDKHDGTLHAGTRADKQHHPD